MPPLSPIVFLTREYVPPSKRGDNQEPIRLENGDTPNLPRVKANPQFEGIVWSGSFVVIKTKEEGTVIATSYTFPGEGSLTHEAVGRVMQNALDPRETRGRYDTRIKNGGYMEIDKQNRQIKFAGTSTDFDKFDANEVRQITEAWIAQYPEFKGYAIETK